MKKISDILIPALAVSVLSGCGMLAVGPDFRSPEVTVDDSALKAPGAGWPMTTNLTETGEFKPASESKDPRTELKAEEIRTWWRQFNDELLSSLVENAARAAAWEAYDAAKTALEIHSPSKKGAWLGEMFDLGFAQGAYG